MDANSTEFDAGLIRRFDRQGPRYTSYPTADRFVTTFDAEAYRTYSAHRNAGGRERGLSLYVHLPFCRDVCFYCACNKIVTRDARKALEYLGHLDLELAIAAGLFSKQSRVTRMHWGGGTPTYYDVDRLRALFGTMTRRF